MVVLGLKTGKDKAFSGEIASKKLEDLKVKNLNAVAKNQIEVTVTWSSPTALADVTAIEVSWTPQDGEFQPKSLIRTSTSTDISGLQGETDYTVTITSKHTSSGSTTISQSVTFNVKTKSALGGTCSSNDNCDGSHVECISSTCHCQSHFYDDNNAAAGGTCKSIDELKVSNVQVSVLNTTSVHVTWTNPADNTAIERKQVRWTGKDFNNVGVDATSTTISGLTPGATYNITVVSIDDKSGTSSQEVASAGKQVTTKPAIPGEIRTFNPDYTGTEVTLFWIASAGVVTSYRVVFDGGNGDTRPNTSYTNTITMTSITPGRRYNITVTAISGSMTSDPRYGNTRTTVTPPGAPTNLSCISIMDTNVTLGWAPPVNPNGDIMFYSINVISGPGSPKTVDTTKPVKTQEIDKLTEDSYYSFTVRARNDLFDGPTSFSATCKTKPGWPSKPRNLSPVILHSRSFTVGWMKPNSTKGKLTGYRIIVQNGSTCSKEILYQCSDCLKKPSLKSSCSIDAQKMEAVTNTCLENNTFVQTIDSLFPYINYSVSVNAITEIDDGYKQIIIVQTKEEAPQNLTQVLADVLNTTAIKLSWSIPEPRPGITKYIINLMDVVNGEQTLNKSVEVQGFYERSTILTNLEEYWQYVINIEASTNKGQSAMKNVIPEKTKPAAPGKVANFMVSRPEGNYKSATLTWSIPSLRDQNSLITSYEFKHNATGTVASKILSQSVYNEDGITESIEVQPENYYYIEVYAINNLNQTGVKSSELYYAPSGPPPKLDSSPDINVIQNNIKNPTKETTATILLYQNQLTADENGKIINNGIILCPEKTQITTQRQYTDYDKFTTWKKAKSYAFKQCYKTTNSSWLQNSKKVTIQKRSTHEYISYTIGEDTTCDQKPDNSYCNGPLNPGTSYKVYTFVCTKGGCTESQSITITTKGTENTSGLNGAVAGPIVAVVVITPAVIVIIIIIKRRNNRAKTGKDATYDDLQMSPYMNQGRVNDEDKTYTSLCEQNKINRYRPFHLSNILQKVTEMHKDSDLKFAKEFQDLEILSPKDQCQTANLQSNRRKNRNGNVLPFDRSRVMFTEEKNNYINASYLQNFRNKSGQDFIVTQHPLSNTIEDFWTMIWEQNVSVIVMLTPQNDDCKISNEKYFPSEPQSSKQYGSVNVETMAKWCIPMTEFSTIKLKKGKKSRMIKHFRSLGMNDLYDGTMQTEMFHLIDAVKSNISSTYQLGPIVVHCSLGTGRSGVFIALYQLIDCINDKTVDIFDLVLTMRESRMNLIENERQYIFIHDCFLHSINDNKTRQRSSLSQVTSDTYEYIHVHELRT